jgi:putative transposase
MNLRYRYRIYPTKEQQASIQEAINTNRFIWNHFLSYEMKTYEETKKFSFYNNNSLLLTSLKKDKEWLSAPSTSYQQTLRQLEDSLKRFFKKVSKFPVFKKKRDSISGSFTLVAQEWKYTDKEVFIPLLKRVKWKMHRDLPSDPKTATVIREGNKYYISFVVSKQEKPTKVNRSKSIGIDLGLTSFIATSNGVKVSNPKFLNKQVRKLKRKQQQLSKKQKASANRRQANIALTNLHKQIRNQRLNFLHQLSNQITNDYDLICVEDLNVKGMMKTRLAKSIGQTGWSSFVSMLEYKSLLKGKVTVKINRFEPTTKICSACGQSHTMPLNKRVMECSCGHTEDRDVNAAKNIKKAGLKKYTAGIAGINACGVQIRRRAKSSRFNDAKNAEAGSLTL